MRKLMVLLLAAGMMLGVSAPKAEAIELQATGVWEFGYSWVKSPLERRSGEKNDTFNAVHRIRPQFSFIASENLQAVLQFEIGDGDGYWGQANGNAIGTDGINVKTRFAYLDWVVPGTEFQVRMGLQPISTPAFTFNNPLMSELEVAGITMNWQICDPVGVSLAWMRPYNNYSKPHDTIDLFFLSVPVTMDGWKVTPYGMYGSIGRDAMGDNFNRTADWGAEQDWLSNGLLPANGDAYLPGKKNHPTAWWLGLGGELTLFDPFRVAADFVYGSVNYGRGVDASTGDRIKLKRRGWAVSAEASYELDWFTPMLGFWYASGDDSNISNGSERLPVVYPSNGITNFGFDGGWFDAGQLSTGSDGKWGISLQFNDIKSFAEDLAHDFRVTYARGTNSKAMAAVVGDPFGADSGVDGLYLTRGDRAWELDFDTKYQIYKNLAAHVELSYIKLHLKEATWGHVSGRDENAYKVGAYLTYEF